jgi:hypothetical protein
LSTTSKIIGGGISNPIVYIVVTADISMMLETVKTVLLEHELPY